MPDTLKEKGEDPFDPRRSELRLRSRVGGGFRLEASGGGWLEVGPVDEVRRELESSDRRHWTLRAAPASEGGGFVVETVAPDGFRELARSVRRADTGLDPWAFYLDDGRVFFAAPTMGPGAGIELHGWEARGAYWTATPHDSCWTLAPTAAGRRLEGSEPVVVLLAAEILAGRSRLAV